MKAALGLFCLIFGHVCYGDDSGSDRIVGGEPAEKGEFPWLVTIFIDEYGICSGTIIDNRTILTTAVCGQYFQKRIVNENRVKVRAGDHLWYRKDDYEKTVTVKRVIVHPQWNFRDNIDKDVALLKLRCELQFNQYVQALPIVPGPWKEKRLIDINDCKIAGFGARTLPGSLRPWQLQKGVVTVKDRWYCAWKIRDQIPWKTFNKNQICTDEDGLSICFGDNGVALACKDGNDDPYLLGIASYITGNCFNGLNVYVRISEFADWIQMYISE